MKKIFNKDNRFITSIIIVFLLFGLRQSFYLLQINTLQYSTISYYYFIRLLLPLLLLPVAIFTLYYLPAIFVLEFSYKIRFRLSIRIPTEIPFLYNLKKIIIIQKNRYRLIQVLRF